MGWKGVEKAVGFAGAKILIFIGRWVKQKGVDHIAMLTPVFLRSHPEVQIVLAGLEKNLDHGHAP